MGIKSKAAVATAVLAVTGTTLLWLYAEQLDDEHEALVADQVEVVKAARNLPSGTPLTKNRIATEKVPRKFLPPNPLLESELNIYLGTPVAVNVEEGAMVLTSDFSVAEVTRFADSFIASPLVIKTAQLHIESDGPLDASNEALAAVAAARGYIVESDLHVTRDSEEFSMKARVPASKFENFVGELTKLGIPVERRIRGAGVSADVAQLEKKIGNSEFLIEGLRTAKRRARPERKVEGIEIITGDGDLHRQVTTTTTNPAAEVAKELAKAEHGQAELERELSELHAETALATVDLRITQKMPEVKRPEPEEPPTLVEELTSEFEKSGRILWRSGFSALRLLAAAFPWLFVSSPAILGLAIRHHRRRREESEAESA